MNLGRIDFKICVCFLFMYIIQYFLRKWSGEGAFKYKLFDRKMYLFFTLNG